MKPTTIYRSLLLLAAVPALVLALAACTKDDEPTHGGSDDNSRTPVLFTAAIQTTATPDTTPDGANAAMPTTPDTRLAPGADATQTVWTADDRIAVFMLPKGGKIPADTLPAAHNVPYSIDPATGVMTQVVPKVYDPETDSFVPGAIVPMYYPMTDGEVDFVAYWPYHPILETGLVNSPYMLGPGLRYQTTPEDQLKGDWLYSDNARGIRRSKDAVALRFRHLNAKLRFDITLGGEIAGGEVTVVKLPGIPHAVIFDMRDGSVDTLFTPSAAVPISCLKLPMPATPGAAATFTALVPPHSGEAYPGRKITVTVDGMDYSGSIPDADAYSGNTMYAYPVTVTHHGVTISAPAGEVTWTDAQTLPKGYDLTIANETELRAFAGLVNAGEKLPNGTPAAEAHVLQTANITLTQGEWTPIGNGGYPFRGAYNGDGHTITGLTITTAPAPTTDSGDVLVGLFGFTEEAVLTGIHLREVKIDVQADNGGFFPVGSIAGYIRNSTLSLCSASGTMNAVGSAVNVDVGGIAGLIIYSTISRCRADVEVKAVVTRTDKGALAGGIAGGSLGNSFILSCEVGDKPVTAKGGKNAYAGGIIGSNVPSNLIAFCRTGANEVRAQNGTVENYAGGLVGNNSGYLYSCYSRATATATGGIENYAGDIAGSFFTNAGVRQFWEKYCYGTGSTGPGTSGLAADPALGIYYETSPGSDAIFGVMKGYTDIVESVTFGGETAYPTATRYDPATAPAYGIEPVRVKWGADAWQRSIDTMYPEIDMTYGGEKNIN